VIWGSRARKKSAKVVLDLIRFRPDLIVYEHKHLNERERTIAADLLIANGYSVQSTAWANTVAMRRR